VVVDCGFDNGGGKDRRLGCEVKERKWRSPNLSSWSFARSIAWLSELGRNTCISRCMAYLRLKTEDETTQVELV